MRRPYAGLKINGATRAVQVVIGWAVELDVLDRRPANKNVTVLETLKRRQVVSDFVFLDEDNKPLAKEKVAREFAMAKGVAGIPRRLRIHDLRHTFTSTLVSSGVNLKVVSNLLGQADIATSARYARGDERVLGEVANVLNRVNDASAGK
ncbi:MAG TPA: tyrosine-type recombinase/integrase [Thermoanaerobaculia bacterium]|nr:tyrosine-type recombinase/integrase [Thermoanaerobaculia bacterium]